MLEMRCGKISECQQFLFVFRQTHHGFGVFVLEGVNEFFYASFQLSVLSLIPLSITKKFFVSVLVDPDDHQDAALFVFFIP